MYVFSHVSHIRLRRYDMNMNMKEYGLFFNMMIIVIMMFGMQTTLLISILHYSYLASIRNLVTVAMTMIADGISAVCLPSGQNKHME